MADDVVIFLCILFLDAYALNLLYIRSSRTVEDRELRTVYLDETVVDAYDVTCQTCSQTVTDVVLAA